MAPLEVLVIQQYTSEDFPFPLYSLYEDEI